MVAATTLVAARAMVAATALMAATEFVAAAPLVAPRIACEYNDVAGRTQPGNKFPV